MQGDNMTEIARNYVIEPLTTSGDAGYSTTLHWTDEGGAGLGLVDYDAYGNEVDGLHLDRSLGPIFIPLESIDPGLDLVAWVELEGVPSGFQELTVGLADELGGVQYDAYGAPYIADVERKTTLDEGSTVVELGPMAMPETAQYLAIYADSGDGFQMTRLRLSADSQHDDGLGLFTGDSDPLGAVTFDWTGERNGSESIALEPSEPDPEEPDPEEPDPGPAVSEKIGRRVSTMLGIDLDDEQSAETVSSAVEAVTMYAYAHTRGRGFTVTDSDEIEPVKPDIVAVIVSAATRYAANPSGLSYRAGTESVNEAFRGWTLVEKATLDRYRKRWA